MSLKHVTVFDLKEGDADWPPTKLLEFLKWLESQVDLIPYVFRDNATIEFGTTTDWDDYLVTMELAYTRPYTKAEAAKEAQDSIDRATANRELVELRERALLAQLKKRYEP
jgi:hypothetical protein